MPTLIHDPAEINESLRTLRNLDRRILDGPDRDKLDALLDSCQVTVEPGHEDTFHDVAIPRRNMLSLFEEEGRRRRVSEISIDRGHRREVLERRRIRARLFGVAAP